MNVGRLCAILTILTFGIVGMIGGSPSVADSGLRTYENHGLRFRHPAELKLMGSASSKKIQGMLNQQFQQMGQTQVAVVGLDVLLNLPAFRVMITKEQFETAPAPDFLIKEREKFLKEAQMRGGVQSFGEMKRLTINGQAAIEFHDEDKGARGYSSSVRILCGKDTWHITFTGSTKATYQDYRPQIERMMQSMSLVDQCEAGL